MEERAGRPQKICLECTLLGCSWNRGVELNFGFFFSVSLQSSNGHGTTHFFLHVIFEIVVLYRQMIFVATPNGFYDVSLYLCGCQYDPSARSSSPLQGLWSAFPKAVPRADDGFSAGDTETTSESTEGITAVSSTVLLEDAMLEGVGVFGHVEAMWPPRVRRE